MGWQEAFVARSERVRVNLSMLVSLRSMHQIHRLASKDGIRKTERLGNSTLLGKMVSPDDADCIVYAVSQS